MKTTCASCEHFVSFQELSDHPESVKGCKGVCFANQPQGFVFPNGRLEWERPVVHPKNKGCLDYAPRTDG